MDPPPDPPVTRGPSKEGHAHLARDRESPGLRCTAVLLYCCTARAAALATQRPRQLAERGRALPRPTSTHSRPREPERHEAQRGKGGEHDPRGVRDRLHLVTPSSRMTITATGRPRPPPPPPRPSPSLVCSAVAPCPYRDRRRGPCQPAPRRKGSPSSPPSRLVAQRRHPTARNPAPDSTCAPKVSAEEGERLSRASELVTPVMLVMVAIFLFILNIHAVAAHSPQSCSRPRRSRRQGYRPRADRYPAYLLALTHLHCDRAMPLPAPLGQRSRVTRAMGWIVRPWRVIGSPRRSSLCSGNAAIRLPYAARPPRVSICLAHTYATLGIEVPAQIAPTRGTFHQERG